MTSPQREPCSVKVGCWVTLAHQLLRISPQAPGKVFALMNFLSPFPCTSPRLLGVQLQVRILFDPPKKPILIFFTGHYFAVRLVAKSCGDHLDLQLVLVLLNPNKLQRSPSGKDNSFLNICSSTPFQVSINFGSNFSDRGLDLDHHERR